LLSKKIIHDLMQKNLERLAMSKLEKELSMITAEKNLEFAEHNFKVAKLKLEVTISCLVNDFVNQHHHEIADAISEDDRLRNLLKEVTIDRA